MLEGMYSAASGMAAQQTRIDALSNDLANANTTGYKSVRVAFRDLLYTPAGPGANKGVVSGAGAAATMIGRSQDQGTLQDTGRPLDLAIEGQGFLEVTDAAKRQVLTRDGALQRGANGRLITSSGDDTGITVPPAIADSEIHILPDGTVRTNQQLYG